MIQNIKALKLNNEAKQKLLSAARLLKQASNIRFKVLRVTKAFVLVGVSQDYHAAEEYYSDSILDECAKELLKNSVDGRTILTETKTYTPSTYEFPDFPLRSRLLPKAKSHRNADEDDQDIMAN